MGFIVAKKNKKQVLTISRIIMIAHPYQYIRRKQRVCGKCRYLWYLISKSKSIDILLNFSIAGRRPHRLRMQFRGCITHIQSDHVPIVHPSLNVSFEALLGEPQVPWRTLAWTLVNPVAFRSPWEFFIAITFIGGKVREVYERVTHLSVGSQTFP